MYTCARVALALLGTGAPVFARLVRASYLSYKRQSYQLLVNLKETKHKHDALHTRQK